MITASELPDYFRSSVRTHPVRFQYGVERELSLSVAVPAGWSMQQRTVSDSLVSRFGSSSYRWQVNDNELLVWNHHALIGFDIKPAEYLEFRDFLDSMRKQNLRDLVLTDARRASVRLSTPEDKGTP
jgi:hypothetical protein